MKIKKYDRIYKEVYEFPVGSLILWEEHCFGPRWDIGILLEKHPKFKSMVIFWLKGGTLTESPTNFGQIEGEYELIDKEFFKYIVLFGPWKYENEILCHLEEK